MVVCKRKNILKGVEETLTGILGSEATRIIINYLDNHYHFEKEEVPL